MNKSMQEFFIFTVIHEGAEKVAMHPRDGFPLLYLDELGLEKDHTKDFLQVIADTHGVTFQLKHFTCQKTLEIIEPMKTKEVH